MRLRRELLVAAVVLVAVGALARTGAGRFVLPLVAVVVVAGLGVLLFRRPAYPRTAVGPRTRTFDSAPAETATRDDAPGEDWTTRTCVECDAPATTIRRYVREWVLLGVPVVLLDEGRIPVCDDHRD